MTGFLGGDGIVLQARIRRQPAVAQCLHVATVALFEFRVVAGSMAQESDAPAALLKQVRGDVVAALEIVAAHRHPRLAGQGGAPTYEMSALLDQPLQALHRLVVVAITQQDDAVGLVAVLEIGVPVAGKLLEGHQQIAPMQGAGAGDRAQHRVEERVDQRIVRGRVLEEQQGQRAGLLAAQAGGVLVDLVVQLPGDIQDALAGLGVDHRAAAQRSRHGGLRNARHVCDIQ